MAALPSVGSEAAVGSYPRPNAQFSNPNWNRESFNTVDMAGAEPMVHAASTYDGSMATIPYADISPSVTPPPRAGGGGYTPVRQ